MKKALLSLLFASLFLSTLAYCVVEGDRFKRSEEAVKFALYGHIDARGLKGLIDSRLLLFC